MRRWPWLIAVSLVCSDATSTVPNEATGNLPIVDLGYTRHRATYNETGKYYSFNGIRYSEPPLGKYRFRPAAEPSTINRNVTDGGPISLQCPQGTPEWSLNVTATAQNITEEELRQELNSDPATTEDCLLVDVVVPQNIWARTHRNTSRSRESTGAPVLVWVHGGGFVFGQRGTQYYSPSGIIARSQYDGDDGVVYVALNYRLGLFGFLNDVGDATPNVGILDQRLAFEWIKKNIHLFGGDPNHITVMGESGGGSSIMFHVTANGGTRKALFERAIAQSPAFMIDIDTEGVWNRIRATAKSLTGREIRNAADLRELDTKALQQINEQVIFDSPEYLYTFGPTVDGDYISKLPGVLLLEGKFDHSVRMIAGHNFNETYFYIPQSVDTREKAVATIKTLLPHVEESDVNYMLSSVYPPPGQTNLYHTERDRTALLVAEMIFVCNTRYLAVAQNNHTHNYRFQVFPAAHAQDVDYTFWDGGPYHAIQYPELAEQMQGYFTRFAITASPNGRKSKDPLPGWPVYGENGRINTFGPEGPGTDVDDARNSRCDYWQRATFLGN